MTLSSTAAVFCDQRLWILLTLTFILNFPSKVSSENSPSIPQAVVKNLWIDPTSDDSGFIVSLALSTSVAFQTSTATNPYRLIIDLPNTTPPHTLTPKYKKTSSSSQPVLTVTDDQSPTPTRQNTRLILTFSKPFVLQSTDALHGQNETTLLMTIVEPSSSPSHPLIPQEHSPSNVSQLSPQKVRKPLVILDPGHGGEDPGAEIKGGLQEKLIVLKVAQQLKEALETSGTLDVVLTRSEDIFIPLATRVRMAREMGADLFISLHADALPSTSSVNGLTVYTLSSVASDSESARLAERENISGILGKPRGQIESEEISSILMDFTTRETRMLSISFSEKLIETWKGELSLNKSPLRSANFLVLKAPDVPSVLIELAYLSNAEDIKRLSSGQWHKQFISGVERAVRFYLEEKGRL